MRRFISVTLAILAGCGYYFYGDAYYLRKAEVYVENGNYGQAIKMYKKYIELQSKKQKEEKGENPYFYYLKIGDLMLKQDDINGALKMYKLAEDRGVETRFISDRYRLAARWYEEKGRLKEAIALLERYRDRDPLLFDAMSDRIAKKLTLQEEAASVKRQ